MFLKLEKVMELETDNDLSIKQEILFCLTKVWSAIYYNSGDVCTWAPVIIYLGSEKKKQHSPYQAVTGKIYSLN